MRVVGLGVNWRRPEFIDQYLIDRSIDPHRVWSTTCVVLRMYVCEPCEFHARFVLSKVRHLVFAAAAAAAFIEPLSLLSRSVHSFGDLCDGPTWVVYDIDVGGLHGKRPPQIRFRPVKVASVIQIDGTPLLY